VNHHRASQTGLIGSLAALARSHFFGVSEGMMYFLSAQTLTVDWNGDIIDLIKIPAD
jgi:hypothetical protein